MCSKTIKSFRPVRVGIVGCGVIGQKHMSAALEVPHLIDLVAVADLDAVRAKNSADKYGVRNYNTGAESILSDETIDAVVLAMPTQGRAHIALDAFACGKHVLVEKPAAMNSDELEKMIHARGSLVGASCSSRCRFLESAHVAEQFLASGALGKLRLIRCSGTFPIGPAPSGDPPAWRSSYEINGGGLLVNWGVYDLDFALGLTGWKLKPQSAFARVWPIAPGLGNHVAPASDGDTHFIAMINCEDGESIFVERSELLPASGDARCEFVGERGTLSMKMIYDVENTITHFSYDPGKGTVSEVIWSGTEDGMILHRSPIQDFASAILNGHDPKTTLEQALVIQGITDAIYESSNSETAVGCVPMAHTI